ncbi:MAG TPA: formate dehydrogenase accessory sulfurtransferase FdhD [Longimicrobiales bacterium]|nr:formate dehydrogenase accessory sulfurtransferase FdhD [Longimicrobiales bacterium]
MTAPEPGGRARAVEERRIRLDVNGRPVSAWTYTPEHARALAAGWLLAEGFIDDAADMRALDVEETPAATIVRAEVAGARAAAAEALRRRRAEGVEGDVAGRGGAAALPATDAFPELFRALYAGAERYQDTGGIHAAALSDGERLLAAVEDIGRHNAVDKAIGLALLAGADLSGLGLVLTARVSGEIARKAARARLGWVASRSVPTTLAVEIAAAAGVPIVARAASKEPFVHAARSGPGPGAAGG